MSDASLMRPSQWLSVLLMVLAILIALCLSLAIPFASPKFKEGMLLGLSRFEYGVVAAMLVALAIPVFVKQSRLYEQGR